VNEIVATLAAPRLLLEKHEAREYASLLILDGRYKRSNDKDLEQVLTFYISKGARIS
jgi:hypothetical protein